MSQNLAYDAETCRPQILAGTIIPALIASIFVIGRFYTRLVLTRNWGVDDSLILIAWLAAIAFTVLQCLMTNYGQGRHSSVLIPTEIVVNLKMLFAVRILYQVLVPTTKLGFCVFYLRIFRDRRSTQAIWVLAAFIIISGIPLIFPIIFQCSPIAGAWNLKPAKCLPNMYPATVASSAVNVLVDLLLIAFAVPRILPLKMVLRQKVSLLAVVTLGFLVAICTIVRVVRAKEIFTSKDPTWDSSDIMTWTSIEINTGLFCVSAPVIKPLIRRFAPGLMSTVTGSGTGQSTNPRKKTSSYGIGSHITSQRSLGRPGRFELGSANDKTDIELRNNKGVVTKVSWGGEEGCMGNGEGDDGSERAVLGTQ